MISFAGSDSPSTWQGGDKRKRRWLACELACEQALLFRRAKRASPERASEGSAPRGFAACSRVLPRLASLAQIAQIGELARRLAISSFFYPHLPVKLKRNLIQQNWSLTIQALKINQETEFGTHKKPMFILFVVIVFFIISSRVKITCYFHMWEYHRCYGYIINRAFRRIKLFQWNGLVFHWCLYNK